MSHFLHYSVDLISCMFCSNFQPEGFKKKTFKKKRVGVAADGACYYLICPRLCRSVRGLLDSRPGDSSTGRAAGQRQPRQRVREVLPGDGRVQLCGQPHHLHSAGQGNARHIQVDPVLPVWKERADGNLATGFYPSAKTASGTCSGCRSGFLCGASLRTF